MPTSSDDIGVWNNLGIVVPTHTAWSKFPVTATGANAVLRVTCTASDWKKVNSFVWLRAVYQTSNSIQVSRSTRVYPHQIQQLIEFPIPQDLQDRSVYFRDFEVKKQLRWRKYIGVTPDAIWDIRLEELWG